MRIETAELLCVFQFLWSTEKSVLYPKNSKKVNLEFILFIQLTNHSLLLHAEKFDFLESDSGLDAGLSIS